MVTIYDIARETGNSAPTISKALNGSGSLSEKTRNKIIETAKRMGYEPNMTARALATKKSRLIGVVYDDTGMNRGFSHPLFSVVLNRFREQVEHAGFDIMFLSRHFKMSYCAHALFRSVDGIVIINPAEYIEDAFKDIIKRNIPCVSTNAIIDGICTVLTENEKSGYEAAEYLIKKGHKKIAFLSGPQTSLSYAGLERLNGFKNAFKDYNIPFDENLYEECQFWHTNSGYEGFERLYNRTQDFTAVFACSDTIAYGVMNFAEKHGLKIPDDFSLIGFDNDSGSEFSHPHLTTFQHDEIKIADMAAEMLFQQIAGIPVPDIVRFPATFIERESVKKLEN